MAIRKNNIPRFLDELVAKKAGVPAPNKYDASPLKFMNRPIAYPMNKSPKVSFAQEEIKNSKKRGPGVGHYSPKKEFITPRSPVGGPVDRDTRVSLL
jgi:hypothetical protein